MINGKKRTTKKKEIKRVQFSENVQVNIVENW